jgi:flagellar FliL protein
MAKAVAIVDPQAVAPKKGPSLVVQIIVLLVLTGVAAGVGLLSGSQLNPGSSEDHSTAPADDGGHGAKKSKAEEPEDPLEIEKKRGLFPLPAITTNLAAPSDTWIRVELSAVFDGEVDMAVADAVHQDLLSFLRTVKLHQVEGASGFMHLKSDLDERAVIRSEGKVKNLLIKTIVFE